jgi:hypothetical protein
MGGVKGSGALVLTVVCCHAQPKQSCPAVPWVKAGSAQGWLREAKRLFIRSIETANDRLFYGPSFPSYPELLRCYNSHGNAHIEARKEVKGRLVVDLLGL